MSVKLRTWGCERLLAVQVSLPMVAGADYGCCWDPHQGREAEVPQMSSLFPIRAGCGRSWVEKCALSSTVAPAFQFTNSTLTEKMSFWARKQWMGWEKQQEDFTWKAERLKEGRSDILPLFTPLHIPPRPQYWPSACPHHKTAVLQSLPSSPVVPTPHSPVHPAPHPCSPMLPSSLARPGLQRWCSCSPKPGGLGTRFAVLLLPNLSPGADWSRWHGGGQFRSVFAHLQPGLVGSYLSAAVGREAAKSLPSALWRSVEKLEEPEREHQRPPELGNLIFFYI